MHCYYIKGFKAAILLIIPIDGVADVARTRILRNSLSTFPQLSVDKQL